MTKESVEGWAGTLGMIQNMLQAKIAPTGTAMKRTGLHTIKKSWLNGSPSAVLLPLAWWKVSILVYIPAKKWSEHSLRGCWPLSTVKLPIKWIEHKYEISSE